MTLSKVVQNHITDGRSDVVEEGFDVEADAVQRDDEGVLRLSIRLLVGDEQTRVLDNDLAPLTHRGGNVDQRNTGLLGQLVPFGLVEDDRSEVQHLITGKRFVTIGPAAEVGGHHLEQHIPIELGDSLSDVIKRKIDAGDGGGGSGVGDLHRENECDCFL